MSTDSKRALVAFVAAASREAGFATWVRTSGWQGDVLRLYFYLPFVAVWGALPFVARSAPDARPALDAPALFWLLAAASLLYLYPAGDFWHVIMTMPVFLPLIALQLDRARRADPQRSGRPAVFAACAAGVLALLAAPPVLSLLTTRAQLAALAPAFARARGIVAISSKYGDAARLVEFLDTQQPAQRTLFVTANQQMLYFLSGRVSALDRYEFVFHLVAAGLIRDSDARALAPESELVAELERQRPLVIDEAESPAGSAVRRAFPQLAAYLEQHYQPIHGAGGYRVLDRQTP